MRVMAAMLLLSSARAFGRMPASGVAARSAWAASRRLSGGAAASLDSEDDKAMYTLGRSVGRQLGELNVFSASDLDKVLMGIKDSVLNADPPSGVDLNEYAPKAQAMFQGKMEAKAAAAEAAGKVALENASKAEGAQTTDSGLVFLSTAEGAGDSPKATDTVKVHYEGRLVDGTVFDSSLARGEPIEFPLSGVIAGWTEGLQLMKPGGKATLTIPAAIGYGARGSPPAIPPGATLVFDVELLEVK